MSTPPALHAISAAAVDIATLPADPAEPAQQFDVVATAFGVALWPLPEFSHTQFMRDHDHDGWLESMEIKIMELRARQARRPRRSARGQFVALADR